MNVIVIMLDSLRADYLGCYGNKWIRTPNIDKLARESTLFENAYPEGLPTIPVRTALFTGKYTFPFRGWQRLEDSDVVLAEILKEHGYHSALISDTYHLWNGETRNFHRGFEWVEWIRGQEGDPYITDMSIKVDASRYSKPFHQWPSQKEWFEQYLRNISRREKEEDYFAPKVMRSAIRWIEKNQNRNNFLLWVDSFDPHEPMDPPKYYVNMYDPGYRGKEVIFPDPGEVSNLTDAELKHIRALYAGEVTMVDKWVGIFLDRIREVGLMDNTLIILLSDHGQPLGDHGIIRKVGWILHEEMIHIPLIIRHPEGIGEGGRIDALVQTSDILPTLLEFLDIPFPPGIHGESIWPLIKGEKEKLRDYAFCGWHQGATCVQNKNWKFIIGSGEKKQHYLRKYPHKESQLFNLMEDPGEKYNVIKQNPNKVNQMKQALEEFLDELR